MGLPTAWTTVQVFGTYLRTDGTPNPGSVWFEVDQDVHINDDGGTPIAVMPKRQIAALDANGHFSIFLPATDDPHITPTGWTYQVSEKFAGGQPDYSITVPAALASTGINLVQYPHATPVPVDPPTVTYLTTADLGVTVGTQGDVTTAVGQSASAVTAASAATTTANNALNTANAASTSATAAVGTANTANATANTASTNASAAVTTANAASTTANTASTNASAAVTTANTAIGTANTANATANSALATANTANTNASSAVTTANAAQVTANAASTSATAAVGTANTANATANTASTNASAAVTTANAASTTANTASTNASAAVTTANTAIGTANTANATANSALATANTANTNASSAVTTANAAQVTANAALPATSNAVSASKWAAPMTLTVDTDASGTVAFDGSANQTLHLTVSHAAAADAATSATSATTAQKWATARTVTVDTDASGSVSLDGSADATLHLTVSHAANADNATNATLAVDAINATSAGRWTTPRTVTVDTDASGSVSLDGSADVTLHLTVAHATAADSATTATSATSATTATHLATARNINISGAVTGSASFDGSADITIATTGGGGGMTNPMTNQYDMIVGGASGTPARLAGGSAGQPLVFAASGQQWGHTVTTITATGSNQSTANALVPGINVLTVAGSSGTSGILPAGALPGTEVIVQLRGSNSSPANGNVYPPVGGAIDQMPTNTAYLMQLVTMTNATQPATNCSFTLKFLSLGSDKWVSSDGSASLTGSSFIKLYGNNRTLFTQYSNVMLLNVNNIMVSGVNVLWSPQDFGNQPSAVTFQGSGSGLQRVTLTGNVTINGNMVASTANSVCRLMTIQDATGGRTVTWGSGIAFKTVPTINAAPNGVTIVEFIYDSTSATFYGFQVY